MKSIGTILAVIFLTIGGLVTQSAAADRAEPVDIENLTIMDGYEPGIGPAMGQIRQVSGKVAVVHQDQAYGYQAFAGMDLFKGDTVLTGKDASTAFKLNDGSFISLSPGSELTITQSVYAPEQKSRSSFMNMISGNARFVVKKFVDARHSEFKVKTKTSVAGVRGSDFIIMHRETVTEIMALENTELEVFSLAVPEEKPVILHDFERTTVRLGASPEEARRLDAEEADRLMREFRLEGMPLSGDSDLSVSGWEAPPLAVEAVFVSEEALIQPDFHAISLAFDQGPALDDMRRFQSLLKDERDMDEFKTRIFQQKNEDFQKDPLPDFPELPEGN